MYSKINHENVWTSMLKGSRNGCQIDALMVFVVILVDILLYWLIFDDLYPRTRLYLFIL